MSKTVTGSSFLFALLTVTALVLPVRRADAIDPSHYTVPLKGRCTSPAAGTPWELRISSADPSFTLPNTPFQRIVTIRPRDGIATALLRTGTAGTSDPPGPGLTGNTRFVNLDDPDIRKTARRLSRDKQAIDAVERFVYTHISRKTFGIPLLPAAAIFQGKAGDCTEHTVLSIALLRSMGIASRAVVGMVFCGEFEGSHDVFVFHMWAEAYYGGRWVLVDSTCPGPKQPSRYVAFTYHNLKSEAPLAYLGALSAIKNLSVECP